MLHHRSRARSLGWLVAALLVALVLPSPRAGAHDIPSDIVIQGFVKPESDRLHFVVRVPLTMLLNLNLPKRGPGYLDLARIDDGLHRAAMATAKDLRLLEDGVVLQPSRAEGRISLPSDRSFTAYETALAHVHGPRLDEATNVFWNQGFFDAHLEYPIRSAASDFSLRSEVAPGLGDRLRLAVRFITPDGAVRAYDVHGGVTEVALDPRWYQAAWLFLKQGVEHILAGTDHLLFLLCLVLPFRRRLRGLVGVVTAFTLGHSLTLIAAAQGLTPAGGWFPPLIETLIAASIVYMAVENVIGASLDRRWFLAGAFGLIHGFGFAATLTDVMQFAGPHLLSSLLLFNVGIEVGQLLVLAAALPVLNLIFRHPGFARYGVVIVSALAGHEAWHWMVERGAVIDPAALPRPDIAGLLTLATWLTTALFVALLLRLALRPAVRWVQQRVTAAR